jgi:YfiH family protein
VTEPRYSARHGRTWITYPELDLPGLVHGVVLFKEFHSAIPHREWTASARAHFQQVPWASGFSLVVPRQVHGTRVLAISERDVSGTGAAVGPAPASIGPELEPGADAVVTNARGLLIGVSVADCLPVLAANMTGGVIGAAHCGWRGIAAGIVEKFVESGVSLAGGLGAGGTRFVIGPAVGPCCYEVGEDLLGRFGRDEVERFSSVRNGKTYFDLKRLVAARLVAAGARPGNISIDKTCTACHKSQLSSYRREGAGCGRILAVLGLSA